MVMAGLLWYDDDSRRPLTAKIIEAIERYRERVGFAPTVCQLPPQQHAILTAGANQPARPKRSRARAQTPVVELPRALRLEPDEHLHPNYFLLGMGEDDLTIPNALVDDDTLPRGKRRIKRPAPLAGPSTRKPATARAPKTAASQTTSPPQPIQLELTQPITPAPSARASARPARHTRPAEITTTAARETPLKTGRQEPKAAIQTSKRTKPATATGEQATTPVVVKQSAKPAKQVKLAKPAKPATGKTRETVKAGKSTAPAASTPIATHVSAPAPARATARKAAKTPAQPT
ncbi:MAG: hypothetical protein ACM3N4_04570, partial [Nitrososphaerota archaeon]